MGAPPGRAKSRLGEVAGAGAAYLSGGGLGGWEFAFTVVATYVACRGLESWAFIGVAWLLHTAWDIVHHIKGNPIIPFAHTSSLGCAICDPVIALWCFSGGRTPRELVARVRRPVSAMSFAVAVGQPLKEHIREEPAHD